MNFYGLLPIQYIIHINFVEYLLDYFIHKFGYVTEIFIKNFVFGRIYVNIRNALIISIL